MDRGLNNLSIYCVYLISRVTRGPRTGYLKPAQILGGLYLIVCVHFFTRFRRPHDLHSVLDQKSLADGSQILLVSVDLCMQRRDGNLASDRYLMDTEGSFGTTFWCRGRTTLRVLYRCAVSP